MCNPPWIMTFIKYSQEEITWTDMQIIGCCHSVLRKEQTVGVALRDPRLHYKATVIKTIFYSNKKRHIGQLNRIESLKVNPCLYGQLIFNNEVQNIQWEKDSLFNNSI